MQLNLKQLKHLSVETASGAKLGHIHDLILQTDGQMIAQYLVKPSVLGAQKYLISRDQILRFTEEKIIVEDNAVNEKEAEPAESQAKAAPEPATTRETL